MPDQRRTGDTASDMRADAVANEAKVRVLSRFWTGDGSADIRLVRSFPSAEGTAVSAHHTLSAAPSVSDLGR